LERGFNGFSNADKRRFKKIRVHQRYEVSASSAF